MPAVVDIPEEIKKLRNLHDAMDCDHPTKEDKWAFQEALEEYPNMWRAVGNMAHNAATNTIYSVNGPESLKLSLVHGWHAIQGELGAEDASPVEKLLIEQVALAWVRHYLVEYAYTDVMHEGGSFKLGNYWEKRLSASQRRLLRACETLARVRKINLQAIQINIANQQVNMSG